MRSQILVQRYGALGENVTFDLSVSALKQEFEKKIVENGKNDQFVDEIETKSSFLWQPNAKIGGLYVRAIKEPTFHQMGDSRDNQQKYGVIG